MNPEIIHPQLLHVKYFAVAKIRGGKVLLKIVSDHVHTVFAAEGVVAAESPHPTPAFLDCLFVFLFTVYSACALAWWSDCSLFRLSFSGPRVASTTMASLSHLVQVSDLGIPNPKLSLVLKMCL